MTAEIYKALHLINQASEDIVKQIEWLRDAGVMTADLSEIHILVARENCAEINVSAVHHLTDRSIDSASQLQKERVEKQQALAGR